MRQVLLGMDDIVGTWVCLGARGKWYPGRGVTIGLGDPATGEILAGVIFEEWTGTHVLMHQRILGEKLALSRKFIAICVDYVFNQLNCARVSGFIPASNRAACSLAEHFGFKLEATLSEAHPTGDLLLYSMHKQDCRWLSLNKDDRYGLSRHPDPA